MIWHEFQKPPQVQPEEETLTDVYAKYTAQPFERGWGTTVGNALRRSLLSSIPGAAVTAIKIEGVDHEFSAMPGVVEDVTDIILNLKQLVVVMHTDTPKFLTLKVKKQGVITAADIEEDADITIDKMT